MSEFPVESNCSNFPSPANKKRPRNQPSNDLRGYCDIPLDAELFWLLYFFITSHQQVVDRKHKTVKVQIPG